MGMLGLLASLGLCALCSSAAQAQGTTVAIGGALQDGNTEIWQRLVQLVSEPSDDRACYSVMTIASGEPDAAAAKVAANLARHGGRGVHDHIGFASVRDPGLRSI